MLEKEDLASYVEALSFQFDGIKGLKQIKESSTTDPQEADHQETENKEADHQTPPAIVRTPSTERRRLGWPKRDDPEEPDMTLLFAMPMDADCSPADEAHLDAVREGRENAVVPVLLPHLRNLRVLHIGNTTQMDSTAQYWLAHNILWSEGYMAKVRAANEPSGIGNGPFGALEEVTISSARDGQPSCSQVFFACFYLPNLKRLKASRVGNGLPAWDPEDMMYEELTLDDLFETPPESIEEIEVRDSRLLWFEFQNAFKLCRNLRKLVYVFGNILEDEGDVAFGVRSSKVQSALEARKDSLQHIYLDHGDLNGYGPAEAMEYDDIQPMTFRALHCLKCLKIAALFLWGETIFGDDFAVENHDKSCTEDHNRISVHDTRAYLVDAFPKSLETLHIAYLPASCPHKSIERLGVALEALVEISERVVPSLKDISIEGPFEYEELKEYYEILYGWENTIHAAQAKGIRITLLNSDGLSTGCPCCKASKEEEESKQDMQWPLIGDDPRYAPQVLDFEDVEEVLEEYWAEMDSDSFEGFDEDDDND